MPLYGGFAKTHGQTLGTITGFTDFPLQILKLDWGGIKREAIEVTNMNVQPTTTAQNFGNKMFIPSAYVDPGELKLQVLHDPTVAFPITDPDLIGPQDLVIMLGPADSTQETFNVFGFVTAYDIDGPLDGKALTATMTVKLTDAVGGQYMYDATGAVKVILADA
jgi:hypothetical protein